MSDSRHALRSDKIASAKRVSVSHRVDEPISPRMARRALLSLTKWRSTQTQRGNRYFQRLFISTNTVNAPSSNIVCEPVCVSVGTMLIVQYLHARPSSSFPDWSASHRHNHKRAGPTLAAEDCRQSSNDCCRVEAVDRRKARRRLFLVSQHADTVLHNRRCIDLAGRGHAVDHDRWLDRSHQSKLDDGVGQPERTVGRRPHGVLER